MQVGVLDCRQSKKRFGFVSAILPSGEVVRYFLGARQLKFISPGTVLGAGCGVLFEVDPQSLGLSSLPRIVNARIYESELKALIAFAAAASPEGGQS
jgi:hypothetical protein